MQTSSPSNSSPGHDMARPQPNFNFDAQSYLAWEAEQPGRHEFVDGEVFAMVGARDSHNRVALNVYTALRDGLRETPCRIFVSDVKLHIAAADSYSLPASRNPRMSRPVTECKLAGMPKPPRQPKVDADRPDVRQIVVAPSIAQRLLDAAIVIATRHHARTTWTAEMDALLGTVPDREAAARLGLSRSTVAKRRMELGHPPSRHMHAGFAWTAPMDALLGTTTDKALAALWGLTERRVIERRKALGIAPPLRRPRVAWTPEMDALVLQCTIQEAAERLGLSYDSVQKRRAKRLQPEPPPAD